jgi:hypothetical protein
MFVQSTLLTPSLPTSRFPLQVLSFSIFPTGSLLGARSLCFKFQFAARSIFAA